MVRLAVANRGRWLVLGVSLLLAGGCAPSPGTGGDKVSSFGRYSGYSPAAYDGWNRYSVYVPMADGTRIALDYYLPTAAGTEVDEPLPVVLHYTRYIRAIERADGLEAMGASDPVLHHLLRHGYAIAVVDARGSGASYGGRDGPFFSAETADGYRIIEWLAAQPWCNGRIGMQGRSYPGITQYHAATRHPPHLVAIFPEMAGPVLYDFVYRGGTYKQDFVHHWSEKTRQMDLAISMTPARVDADPDGVMRDAAVEEHAGNMWAEEFGPVARFRDSVVTRSDGATWSWREASVIDNAAEIASSGVAVYNLAGWYDTYTTQQPLMYANLGATRQKMLIGPWTHSGGYGGRIHRTEILRWYDYWLKGIDNHVMDEEPIHYYVMRGNNTVPDDPARKVSADQERAEDGATWEATSVWPPSGITPTAYYLAAGPSGSVGSVNDGLLVPAPPVHGPGADRYTVDYTSTTGSFTRWTNSYGARRSQPEGSTFFDERTSEDEKALTYTTPPLTADMELVGYPVVHLWVTSTHPDGDFIVYLEEVGSDGRAHYVAEGALRASHRALARPPYRNFGLPYHPSVASTLADLPDEPVELVFDLMGTAVVIDAGHRVRLTVAGADARDTAPYPDPEGRNAPTVSLYHDLRHPSHLELPVHTPGEAR